jgi:hypothetical protein
VYLDLVDRQFASWFERQDIPQVEADGHLNSSGHRVVGETSRAGWPR